MQNNRLTFGDVSMVLGFVAILAADLVVVLSHL